jgi:regulator of sigma E protease
MMGKMITGKASAKNLSGPISNAQYAGQTAEMGLVPFFKFLALVSISLGVLNLLPIPPLDGGRIMAGLLSDKASRQYSKIEPYGFFIIIGLMLTGLLSHIIFPVISVFLIVLSAISGLDTSVFYRLLNGIQ